MSYWRFPKGSQRSLGYLCVNATLTVTWILALCSYNKFWARLFKGWITLSTGWIAIQRIRVNKKTHAIRWIVIYPVDSVIEPLNNRDLQFSIPEPDDEHPQPFLPANHMQKLIQDYLEAAQKRM